jgi:CD36 family
MRIAPNIPLRTKSPKPCNVCAGVCFALVIIGILLSTLIHNVIYQALSTGLSNKFVLSGPDAQDFAPWSEANNPSSPDIITDFYIVHVLNPNEVALNGAKPNVTEIGPLRYHFYRQRLNVTWDSSLDDDQLSFIPYNYYVIESDDAPYQANVLCENDPTSTCTVTTTASKIANSIYTTVNVPLIGILHSAGADLPGLLYDIIQSQNMTQPSALFIQKTAEEIIFGWEDPLLRALSGIAGNPSEPSEVWRRSFLQNPLFALNSVPLRFFACSSLSWYANQLQLRRPSKGHTLTHNAVDGRSYQTSGSPILYLGRDAGAGVLRLRAMR